MRCDATKKPSTPAETRGVRGFRAPLGMVARVGGDGPRGVEARMLSEEARPGSGTLTRSGRPGPARARPSCRSKSVPERGLAAVGADPFGRALLAGGDVRPAEDRLIASGVLGVAPQRPSTERRLA